MIISEWSLSFETGALPEPRLRAIANEMFQGRVGRDYWRSARELRLSTSAGRRNRRFHQILEEEYQRAQPPAASRAPRQTSADRSRARHERLLWVGVGAAGTLLYRFVRNRA